MPPTEKERLHKMQDKLQAILSSLLREEENKYCADCDCKGPRWASWNLGIFLCIRCAGIHRNLGVHITKVKSVNLDQWTEIQIASMQAMGNSRAKAIYEANLPENYRRSQSDSAMEQFIRGKYEHQKWIDKTWTKPEININTVNAPESVHSNPVAASASLDPKKSVKIGSIQTVQKKKPSETTPSQQTIVKQEVKAAVQPDFLLDFSDNNDNFFPAPISNNNLADLQQPTSNMNSMQDLFSTAPTNSQPNGNSLVDNSSNYLQDLLIGDTLPANKPNQFDKTSILALYGNQKLQNQSTNNMPNPMVQNNVNKNVNGFQFPGGFGGQNQQNTMTGFGFPQASPKQPDHSNQMFNFNQQPVQQKTSLDIFNQPPTSNMAPSEDLFTPDWTAQFNTNTFQTPTCNMPNIGNTLSSDLWK